MKVLVIGSGGREHALVWAAAKSKNAGKIYCAPGNAGTKEQAENINIAADDIAGLLKFAKEKSIDLTVVGPEIPLVNGIVDIFESQGLKVFGPNKSASMLEGSKVFTKNLLKKYKIPTADYGEFDSSDTAKKYIKSYKKYPVVIKADGLAAGKGVIIANDEKEAIEAIENIMEKKEFGKSGNRIIVEEFLEGDEASILAIVDSKTVLPLPAAQDHKRIFDGDKGPNTGGMGAYAPAPVIDKKLSDEIMGKILKPTIAALKSEGIIYKGILYAGLMITKDGPKVLEYNVRFGDPETQAVLPLLKNDIIDLFMAAAGDGLNTQKLEIEDKYAVCVVMASKGYPGVYEKGMVITGLEKFKNNKDTLVFHAGTKENGKDIISSGGRVLNVVSLDKDLKKAIDKVYTDINDIIFEGAHFRKDIAKRALK